MNTDGLTGEIPDWYYLVRAARYLNCPPWELAQQPGFWLEWALQAEAAEKDAHRQRAIT